MRKRDTRDRGTGKAATAGRDRRIQRDASGAMPSLVFHPKPQAHLYKQAYCEVKP